MIRNYYLQVQDKTKLTDGEISNNGYLGLVNAIQDFTNAVF